jgi:hypothetical protein
MNSSKRGPVYGFKLASLETVIKFLKINFHSIFSFLLVN